jgi:dUTP pyrophosphatase
MGETIPVKIERMHPDVVIPSYKHEDDSGMDIRAFFHDEWITKTYGESHSKDGYTEDDLNDMRFYNLCEGERIIIPTGIKVAIPMGYEIQVRPRSGMAIKSGVTVLNTPGTVDAGYRGEVGIILYNSNLKPFNGSRPFRIEQGDRIAQLVLQKVPKLEWEFVDSVEDDSTRGEGGFGSTGVA